MRTRSRTAIGRSVLILCVVVLLISGCGKSAKKPTATAIPVPTAKMGRPVEAKPDAKAEATVRFALSDVERPIYEDALAQFEEKNPDIDVQIVSVEEVLGLGALGNRDIPNDAEERLVAAADVVKIGISRETVRKRLVRDLGPLMEVDSGFDAEDFLSGTLERYQWGGGTWALPTTVYWRLIFFNKDAFDAAGVAHPEAGWTWDDLAAKAAAVTERQGDEVLQWGFVSPTTLAYRIVESKAGGLADYGTEPPTPRLDGKLVVDALEWYASLHLEADAMPYGGRAPEGGELAMAVEEEAIDKGLAAMWPDLELLYWYRQIQGNVGVVPFPVDTEFAKTTPGWANTVAMSAGTRQPDAAWRLMTFLSRQTLSGVGQGTQYMPARRSAAQESGYWDALDPELATALRYALDHAYITDEPVGYDPFLDALHAVLSEERPVADALGEAQAEAGTESEATLLEGSGATPVPTFVVGPAKKEAVAATTIAFMPGLGSFNLEPYRLLADQFHEANPDIAIELKMLDITGAGGGAPDLSSIAKTSDCFQWYPSLQDPKSLAAVLSLEPFLEADESLEAGDFYPQLIRQFTKQGRLWGLPADVTPFVIEYNRDLFDATGVSYPSPSWTWDDFLDAAVALTQGEGESKHYGYVAEVYEANDLLLVLTRLGASLLDEAIDPAAYTLNDPSVAEAMRWYADLTTVHGAKPAFITDISKMLGASSAYVEREGLINKGRAAMWTNAGTMAAIFGPRGDLNVGVAPLPRRADGTSTASLLATSGYFVSATTEHRLACWKWLTFLTEQPTAVLGYPARRSLAESVAYGKLVGEERAAALAAAVIDAEEESALQVMTEEDWVGGALFWLFQAYGQVLEGKAEPEEALDEAQRKAEAYRDCLIAADDYGRESWQGCLKSTDPELPDFILAQG